MPRPEALALSAYLRAVRRVERRRTAVALLVDIALFAGLWACVVIVGVGLSLRGDLGTSVGAVLGALLVGGLITLRHHDCRERLGSGLGSDLGLARAISCARGPLRVGARDSEADAVLRHELLGATELWLQLEAGDTGSRSAELAAAYVRRIGQLTFELDPRLALPRPARRPRIIAALLVAAAMIATGLHPIGAQGLALLRAGVDGRPPPEPQPVWTSLVLVLDYPDHTRRPDRRVPNPSGAIRVPAGTVVHVELDAAADADAARVVVTHDNTGQASTPAPEVFELERATAKDGNEANHEASETSDRRWTGSITVRGPGSAVVALLDLQLASRHSAPMRIELELDALPEVELLPLPERQREANETDRVDLRFSARDDFGLTEATLVYELMTSEGELERHRLPAGRPPGGVARTWQHRHSWDLSAIPLESRAAVSYWIEVRDNDPGLGLHPLPDGPGKVASSARQQLLVHDEEAEHAANIRDLQAIRDVAVDLLAARLTTSAFRELDDALALTHKLRTARRIHDGAATLLTMIASAVDALAVDTMIAEREVESLAGIHARLLELHHAEAKLHETLPVGAELDPSRAPEQAPLLRKLGPHNQRELEQLEDEIIRLDDLVDNQIIAHIETLVARLQVSQQKLVEKLEQLAAGDESVRPEIEQLEQRIREDMRRIQDARSQLRKEVGDEWLNLDAFRAMEARMRSQELLEQLRRGDVDGALQQAREQLDAIQQLRGQVQQQGAEQDTPALSEEDRQRMHMLRELSRLQDEQTSLRSETRRLEQQWRDQIGGQRAKPDAVEQAKKQAEQLREALEKVDDSNLSREGRTAWEDAREALQALEQIQQQGENQDPPPSALELFDAANEAADAINRAQRGSKPGEAEADALRELAKRAERLRDNLREPLPEPDEVLDGDQTKRLSELAQRQRTLRERARRLLDDPAAEILPEPGRSAMDRADRGMGQAGDALDDAALDGALGGEQQAWEALQHAIDSLRQGNPPPPPSGASESSTEAERDRSLRDQVVEAMREGDRDGFDDDTKRYYEELLR